MKACALLVGAVLVLSGCGSGATTAAPPSSQAASPVPAASATPSPTPLPSLTPAETAGPSQVPESVVCEFFTGAASTYLHEAINADLVGDNSALPTREAIDAISALATKATDPVDKKDLTTLADAMDKAVMSGGDFADWDPACEAFFVKYATKCGQPIAN
jgi:PBP1b-binding outer membrane lipoprotein LpoB